MPRQRRHVLAAMVGTVGLLGLTGCKSPPPPPPPARIVGSIQAAPALNPSVSQRPSPLRLRVYELRSPTAFNQADFMALYQGDQAALGADLLGRDEFVLQPGETLPVAKVLAPDTRFLGVFAVYRDLERATWRALVPVQPSQVHQLDIRADTLAVSATIKP
jgi:type VI secretion system protein VasD